MAKMPPSAEPQYYRAPQPLMWTTGNAVHSGHDEHRRYASGGSSTAARGTKHGRHSDMQDASNAHRHGNGRNSGYRTSTGASGSSSACSHPSPSSSSVTSTSSSLRTPPDLLLNGGAHVSHVAPSSKDVKNGSSIGGNGKDDVGAIRHLSVSQVEDRLKILARLSRPNLGSDLPSPPASPRLKPRSSAQAEHESSRKRKAANEPDDSSTRVRREKPRKSRDERHRQYSSDDAASPNASSSNGDDRRSRRTDPESSVRSASESDDSALRTHRAPSLPRSRAWTRELYFDTAAAYRARGRELKHSGDQRMREASSSASSTSPQSAMMVAALEQTDALLLYTYGFWCEDQGSASCVSNNWTSLFGLLKYVKTCHDRNKLSILASLCRLLEASVLRHLSTNEMRRLHHRLSKAATSASSPSGDDSTSSDAKKNSRNDDPANASIADLSQALAKALSEQERSARLYTQARQNVLNLAALKTSYPHLASQCRRLQSDALWTATDPADLALRLDPSGATSSGDTAWTWPLDTSSPFPILVSFGRALLREAAREHRLPFSTEAVKVTPSKTRAA